MMGRPPEGSYAQLNPHIVAEVCGAAVRVIIQLLKRALHRIRLLSLPDR